MHSNRSVFLRSVRCISAGALLLLNLSGVGRAAEAGARSKTTAMAVPKDLNAAVQLRAAAPYFQVRYEASTTTGELGMPVVFTMWIPPGLKTLRGVIVRQHGCGVGAADDGLTAAYDLHWQALARKWDCALLAPSYRREATTQLCGLWLDPRKGSEKAFLQALHDLGNKSGHAELPAVPWALWGHSGGGFWASFMHMLHPERIVGIWLRSGSALMAWEVGELPKPSIPAAAWDVPLAFNVGEKELLPAPKTRLTWRQTFESYRKQGALISWVVDPLSGHDCGDSRYAAIAFFDACLAQRLPRPATASQQLQRVNWEVAWMAEAGCSVAAPIAEFKGDPTTASWLPDARFARVWTGYVKTGRPADDTPPPAPMEVVVDAAREITWRADIDLESGLAGFIIQRDGMEIGRLPRKSLGKFGTALFQGLSHGDTPIKPDEPMRFVDQAAPAHPAARYSVTSINAAGLKSAPAAAKPMGH